MRQEISTLEYAYVGLRDAADVDERVVEQAIVKRVKDKTIKAKQEVIDILRKVNNRVDTIK